MILELVPQIQSMTAEEKTILAGEILDDLNAPELDEARDSAILEVLSERMEKFRSGEMEASKWAETRERLREKTGVSWQK